MDFKKASDRAVAAGITLEQIAEASGRALRVIHHARMYPASSSYEPLPHGWQTALARLARERAISLEDLADDLEKGLSDAGHRGRPRAPAGQPGSKGRESD